MTGVLVSGGVLVAVWVVEVAARRASRAPQRDAWRVWERAETIGRQEGTGRPPAE